MSPLSLFKRRQKPDPAGVRWRTVAAADLADHPHLVADMRRREFDGLTVTGVFPAEACAEACARLGDHLAAGTPVVFGVTLGRPLLQGGMSADTTEHRADGIRLQPVYQELFGFDPHQRLGEVLAPALDGLSWAVPVEDGEPYNGGNIRYMEPGGGGLAAHAGNEFLVTNAPGSARHLLATTDAIDHMSYFVMMQPPAVGGELSVYERLWVDPRDDEAVPTPLENDHEFDDLPHISVTPGPGDLILFNAGRRWHRVEKIGGEQARITYGGFVAPSLDGTALNCWA